MQERMLARGDRRGRAVKAVSYKEPDSDDDAFDNSPGAVAPPRAARGAGRRAARNKLDIGSEDEEEEEEEEEDLVGKRVQKHFDGHGTFQGTVISRDCALYKVRSCSEGGVRSHCHFRNRGTENISEYGVTWMSGAIK
jgi:hypothetical protein